MMNKMELLCTRDNISMEEAYDYDFDPPKPLGEFPHINCSDVFFWGCADSEVILEEDIKDFDKALKDCDDNNDAGQLLYCARKMKERPQGAYYSLIPEKYWSLFNEAGPEKEVGFGNPYAIGEYDD